MSNFELIDKYFENSLSPKEQLKFNELLENDSSFKEEFLFQKDLKIAIHHNQNETLKKTLQEFEKEFEKPSKIIQLSKKWWIAASILAIAAIGLWFTSNNYPSNDTLFADNFEAYRNVVLPVERGSMPTSIAKSAFTAYENGDYNKAIHLFNDAKQISKEDASFYKAMCYLSLNKPKEAIPLLRPIADAKNTSDKIQNLEELANWYLALAYLKNNEVKNAIFQLEIIAENPEFTWKKEEVLTILDQLK